MNPIFANPDKPEKDRQEREKAGICAIISAENSIT